MRNNEIPQDIKSELDKLVSEAVGEIECKIGDVVFEYMKIITSEFGATDSVIDYFRDEFVERLKYLV